MTDIGVVVVGAGRVASLYDAKPKEVPRSHIGAILAVPGMSIAALIDTDKAALAQARSQWPTLAATATYSSLAELTSGAVQVIVLATPLAGRQETLRLALERRPRILFVEKPLAASAAEAAAILDAARRAGVTLRVNFPRRFDPAHRKLKAQLSGMPRKAVMRYGKGLTNYGSHMIDLLLDWFGPILAVQAWGDGTGAESALTLRCAMAAGFDAILVGIDGLGYDQFEIDLLYPDTRIELASLGIERRCYRPETDRFYPGYTHLAVAESETGTVGGMAEAYAAMRDHLHSGAALEGCDGESAMAGIAVIEAALRSARAGGRIEQPALAIAA